MRNNAAGGGSAPRVSDVHIVAVYDPDDGRIAHLHTVAVFEGGRAISENEAVSAAVALARKAGHPVERLKAKASKDAAHGKGRHRIDVTTGNFVPIASEPKARG